jgi:hypothetical protein
MSFDQAAVAALFNSVVSKVLTLGVFQTVNQHEPKSAPGNGMRAFVWVDAIQPVGRASGLSSTSGVVTLNVRIYSNFLQMPLDGIDPDILTATSTVMNAFSNDFTLGGTVREIDLLGMYGAAMGAVAGYITQENKVYRIMTVTLPVVLNDLWLHGGTLTDSPNGTTTLTVEDLIVLQNATIGGTLSVAGGIIGPANDYISSQAVASGETSIPRVPGMGNGASLTSQVLMLTYWTATKTETVNNIGLYVGVHAAAATPTYAAMGVYSVDGSGNLTLLGQCASDTTLFATTFTPYTRAVTTPFTKTAGQRYAFGVLVVSAAAMPNFYGYNATVPWGNVAPIVGGQVSGQSTLPASITTGSITTNNFMNCGLVTP